MKLDPRLLLIPGIAGLVVSSQMAGIRTEKVIAQNPQMAFLSNSFDAPVLSYQPVWSRLIGTGAGVIGLTCAMGSLFPGSQWKKIIILAKRKRELLVTKAETAEDLATEVSKVLGTSVTTTEEISNDTAAVELDEFSPNGLEASDKEQLLALINKEAPWLLRLLCCPLVFVGGQRSGKSTAAQAIALIRGVIFGGDTHWIHPHGESDRHEICSGIKIFGEKKNWGAIIEKMEAHLVEKNNPDAPRTTIFDELAAMDGVIPVELISRLWRLSFSESTKFNRFPILLTHGTTATFRGGAKGCTDVINSLPTITIKPASDEFSRPIYSNQWTLSNIQGLEADFDVIRPSWLRPEWLINNFNLPPFYTDEAPKPVVATTSARRLPPPPPTHTIKPPANPAPLLSPLATLVKERKENKGQLRIDDLLHVGIIQAGEIHKGEQKLQEIANRVTGSTFHPSTPTTNPYISWS